ncbi:AraC family transcriptional regulator [Psychroserpens burtonensis]|uniref:AraC family transcriptional regulator n=2 Tax=Psychroserpens burtonensis TaxID=49278 RepID=A0A5C7B206_9FLAO|nr:AraC family transcriptional regulator [Psychroserpens burtonensis]
MLKTIQICSIIISVLTFLVIIFKHKRNTYQKILLLIYVISLAYYSSMIFMIKTGSIINYPHFWNTGTPINYLHLATFMIFVRSIVKNLKSPKKLDIILFLLPLASLINFVPFYLKDLKFKTSHIRYLIENEDSVFYATESLIPAYWNYLFQFALGVIFSCIAIFMILKVIKLKEENNFKSEFIWLICISILMLLGNLAAFISLFFDSSSLDTHSISAYLFALYIIIIFSYPFFEPKVLYGALVDVKQKISGRNENKTVFITDDLENYKAQIESFFNLEVSYLKSDFRQDDLAKFLSIQKKELSQITNLLYHKNFNQLVNEKRIDVVLKKFADSEWLNYSLEGVSLEVGFKSRTTFIKAFKEKTGITPSEYKKMIS